MARGKDSFAAGVREELLSVIPAGKGEKLAELAGILRVSERETREDSFAVFDSEELARKVFTLLKKAFNIMLFVVQIRTTPHGKTHYAVRFPDGKCGSAVLGTLPSAWSESSPEMLRGFLRGLFLVSGTVSDPEKSYRLELFCREEAAAREIQDVFFSLGLSARRRERKGGHVVYLQEAGQVSDALGLMGAGRAMLAFENTRIVRETRGNVTRKVNCETSNIEKTARSAARQIREIRYLEEKGILSELPSSLREMAEVRLANPELPLSELGELLNPKVGRSGVNHRLRKLCRIAGEYRMSDSCTGREL